MDGGGRGWLQEKRHSSQDCHDTFAELNPTSTGRSLCAKVFFLDPAKHFCRLETVVCADSV